MLPFSGNLTLAAGSAAALLAALVLWVSKAPLDDEDDDGRDPGEPDPGEPSPPIDWEQLERSLHERVELVPA